MADIERSLGSLPPTHLLLTLLDEAKGKPQLITNLVGKLSERLADDNLLKKYADLESIVEGDLDYLRHLQLAEEASDTGWRITSLGSLLAMGLTPASEDPKPIGNTANP